MKWKKLLLIGDSNMQFGFSEGKWVGMLSECLVRKCDVINRGFSGYTTKYIKLMLPELLEEFDPESTCGVIILLGSNDAAKEGTCQHVPLNEYCENLKSIVEYLTTVWGLCKERILLISPPKVDDIAWNAHCNKMGYEQAHFDQLTNNYAKECTAYAKESSLACLDLNSIMLELGDSYKTLLYDGLHFSNSGSKVLFDALKPMLEKNILKDTRLMYPLFIDIDNQNPVLKQ